MSRTPDAHIALVSFAVVCPNCKERYAEGDDRADFSEVDFPEEGILTCGCGQKFSIGHGRLRALFANGIAPRRRR